MKNSQIQSMILFLKIFPGRIGTYNLDFRGFHTRKGGLQFFRKIENLFFSLTPLEKKCHVEGTETHHIDTPLAKRTLKDIGCI